MFEIYLLATQDDPSLISSYEKGDRIHVENPTDGSGLRMPVTATNCSRGISFLLKHLDHFDHFVDENLFYPHAVQMGLLEQSPDGTGLVRKTTPDQGTGTSWWWYGVAAATVLVGGLVVYGVKTLPPPKKSWMDNMNPWYKPPTLTQRFLTHAENSTRKGFDAVVRASPLPEDVTLKLMHNALCNPNRLTYAETSAMLDKMAGL